MGKASSNPTAAEKAAMPILERESARRGMVLIGPRGQKARIDVCNFAVLGVPAGHYCYRFKRGRFAGGFLLKYDEMPKWRIRFGA